MLIHPARERFRFQIALDDQALNLADAALCVAWEDRGQGSPDLALQQLDHYAAMAQEQLVGLTDQPTIVGNLGSYLFEDLGFRGNTWSYGDPQNSYLDDVLSSRVGLPITLSVVYLEIAWRLQLPVVGVALPGHFIVRHLADDQGIFVDPFHRGRIWSYAECEAQVRRFYGTAAPEVMLTVLEPPTRHEILARMLRNLKGSYVERGDFARAYAAVERIIMIEGETPQELRDRGLLHARMGRVHRALEDLDTYARLAPDAPDLDAIRRHVAYLSTQLGRVN